MQQMTTDTDLEDLRHTLAMLRMKPGAKSTKPAMGELLLAHARACRTKCHWCDESYPQTVGVYVGAAATLSAEARRLQEVVDAVKEIVEGPPPIHANALVEKLRQVLEAAA